MQPSEFDALTTPAVEGYVRVAREIREGKAKQTGDLAVAMVKGIAAIVGVLR